MVLVSSTSSTVVTLVGGTVTVCTIQSLSRVLYSNTPLRKRTATAAPILQLPALGSTSRRLTTKIHNLPPKGTDCAAWSQN